MAKIGRDQILEAWDTFHRYKDGKAQLDQRIIDNEKWFRLQHWNALRVDKKRRQTGWLFAAIINKHADFMDNKPEVTVLPREQSDEKTAQALTEIMPVIMERGGWEQSYSRGCFDKLKFGAGAYAVLWDPAAENGLGDVRVPRVDALNLFWEPGIEDIQQSKNLFHVQLVDHDVLKETYPKNKDVQEHLSAPSETVTRYTHEDYIDTSKKSLVVEWYYKKEGKVHYAKFVQDILLFASENEAEYKDRGWYDDGLYPFVLDPMFPEPDTPHGFGIIDAMRDTQEDIDELNDLQMRNAKIASKRRWFVRRDAQINEAEFADFDNDFIHVNGNMDEFSLREIANEPYSGTYVSILENKIQELKENSFNRDVSNGGASGTTTAAGIATLAENSSKSSRSAIQATYRAYRQIINMVIERIRQFYDVPRIFRIVGEDRQTRFVSFSNEGLQGQPVTGIEMDFASKEPTFDLDVRVAKSNAWSRAAQNQDVLNFFGLGFFNPQMATQALACLEVLELDNKDKLIQIIQKNGTQQQFMAQFLPMLLQAAQMVDPQMAAAAMQAAVGAGLIEQPQAMPETGAAQLAETDANGQMQRSNNYMEKQRQIAAARTAPVS